MDVLEELKSFVAIWIWTVAALYYCYSAVSAVPKGSLRLLVLLPVFFFLVILPLKLSSFILGGPTATLLTWLCNFRLLLFAFGKGPLAESSPNLHFLSLACLPIMPRSQGKTRVQSRDVPILPRSVLFQIKVVLLALMFKAYEYKHYVHPFLVLALYCAVMYLVAEIVLTIFAVFARVLLGSDLDPHFNEPYLATSLQDFWGHRWNLLVTDLMRSTIYHPIRNLFTPFMGRDLASLPAAIATFMVSGLMHELIYYYITRVRPTWEVTCFFVLHGVCVVLEVAAKTMNRSLGMRWRLHRAVSGPLTVAFVVVTAVCLFFPQLTRNGVDEKAMNELYELLSFGKQIFGTVTSMVQNNHCMYQ